MRYKAMFAAGLVAGFIAGTRAGRERYDQIVRLTRQAAGSPPVQKATATVTARTTDLAKTAVPKIAAAARQAGQQAAGRLPFAGKGGVGDSPFGQPNGGGGRVPSQADGAATFNGMRRD